MRNSLTIISYQKLEIGIGVGFGVGIADGNITGIGFGIIAKLTRIGIGFGIKKSTGIGFGFGIVEGGRIIRKCSITIMTKDELVDISGSGQCTELDMVVESTD